MRTASIRIITLPIIGAGQVAHSENFYFCRITQLGVLRLLTTASAMGAEVLTQSAAWATLDLLIEFWGGIRIEEPLGFDAAFRKATMRDEPSPKHWADAYLAAFARGHELSLITFDKALAKRAPGSILLHE